MKLASIRLVTNNVAALALFYEGVTGVAPRAHPDFKDDFAELTFDGVTLAICSHRSVEMFNAGAAFAADNRSAIIEFQVNDVDAERSRLATIVRDWVQEPTKQPWGNRSMLFRDPDGTLVNMFTPPTRP